MGRKLRKRVVHPSTFTHRFAKVTKFVKPSEQKSTSGQRRAKRLAERQNQQLMEAQNDGDDDDN